MESQTAKMRRTTSINRVPLRMDRNEVMCHNLDTMSVMGGRVPTEVVRRSEGWEDGTRNFFDKAPAGLGPGKL